MPGRKDNNDKYRYGFNGKEKDDSGEWGSNTNYDYGFRIYNPSIGKFLSVDPLTQSYPMLTPYQFASNRPIDGIDLDGLEYKNAKDQWQYNDYLGGTLINIDEDKDIWVLVNTKLQYRQTYNMELYSSNGGWGPKIEYIDHLKTGTGYGLSAEVPLSGNYTDPIGNAAFVGIGGALLLAPLASSGFVQKTMEGVSTGFSLFKQYAYEASLAGFAVDFTAQATFNVIDGKSVLGNYNLISGLSNGILKSPYAANYIGSQFSYSLDEGFNVSNFEGAAISGIVGGKLGQGVGKTTAFLSDNFRIDIGALKLNDLDSVTNPIASGIGLSLDYASNLINGIIQKEVDEATEKSKPTN